MPYAIRGVIWYQGESNAGRAYQYRDMFPLMIQSGAKTGSKATSRSIGSSSPTSKRKNRSQQTATGPNSAKPKP